MSTTTISEKARIQQAINNLGQFIGTTQYFKCPPFNNIVYTDGVKYVMDNIGAWIVTDIMAVISCELKVKSYLKRDYFLSIDFKTLEAGGATANYTDGNNNILYTQNYDIINLRDCQATIKFFAIYEGERIVLILSSEY